MSSAKTEMITNPYIGPYAFTQQDKDRFFGRDLEGMELLEIVSANRLVLFYAQSGAGKSSLINAYLIPKITNRDYKVLPVGRVSGVAKLSAKNPYMFNLASSLIEKQPDSTEYEDLHLTTILRGLIDEGDGYYFYRPKSALNTKGISIERNQDYETGEKTSSERRLLIIDQFEEIFTTNLQAWKRRSNFFDQLRDALEDDANLFILLVLREEYVAQLDPYTHLLPNRMQIRYYMEKLSIDSARLAITKPARKYGRPFDQEAEARILKMLSELEIPTEDITIEVPYVEPLHLQVYCYQLWDKQHGKPCKNITINDLEAAGDISTALRDYFDLAIASVTSEVGDSQISEEDLRYWIENHLMTSDGVRVIIREGKDETAGLPNEIVDLIVAKRLVNRFVRGQTVYYELAHDRLADPILSSNAEVIGGRKRLLLAAKDWIEEGKDSSYLWRGDQLNQALKLQYKSEIETEFVNASIEVEEAERELLKRSREKEIDLLKERQTNLRIRRYLVAAISVAVVAILAFIFAFWAYRESQLQKSAALTAQAISETHRQIAETERAIADGERAIANTERAKADNERAIAETERAIADEKTIQLETKSAEVAFEATRAEEALTEVKRLATQTVKEQAVALSQRLASEAQQIVASDPDLSALLSIEAFKASRTTAATKILLSSIYTSTVTIESVFVIGGFSGDIYSLAISPDEKLLGVGCGNGEVLLVDLQVESPRPIILPARHDGKVIGLAFSPDGSILASSGNDRKLILSRVDNYDYQDYQLASTSSGLSYQPSGEHLAVAEGYRYSVFEIIPGSLELGQKTTFLRGSTMGYIYDIKYSADGTRLAVSHKGEEGVDKPDWVVIYNAENGGREHSFGDHNEFIPDIAWSSDNLNLISVSNDGQIISSDTIMKTNKKVTAAHDYAPVYSVSMTYDDSYLITGGWDGYVRVWALPDLKPLGKAPNTDPNRDVLAVTFSPRSYLFASGGTDKVVIVRRLVTQPSLAEPITRANGMVRALVVDPSRTLFWLYLDSHSGYYQVAKTGSTFLGEKPADIGRVFSVALHPNGNLAAYGSNEGEIFTVLTEEPFADPWPRLETRQPISALTFNDEGSQLASSFCNQSSSDGKCVSNSIWLWDVETREPQYLFEVESVGLVNALAFRPDGKYLAVGAENGSIIIYDLVSQKPLPWDITDSNSEILSLAYSRDGNMLAGGNQAGVILFWDAGNNYQDIGQMNISSSGSIYSLVFDRDEQHLYTGGANGDIRKWVSSPDLWVDIICQRVGRNMYQDEWRKFFFSEEVGRTCNLQ